MQSIVDKVNLTDVTSGTSDYKSFDDDVLVDGVRNGNSEYYAELVSRHRKALVRFVVRITKDSQLAEDVVQDALIKAYTKIHMFRGQSTFKSWLYRITVNTAKNKLRKRKRETVDVDNVQMTTESTSENDLFMEDLRSHISTLVEDLPQKQRLALILRIFEDLSFKEIAKIMDCPYDTAKANYRHAVIKLKGRLQKSNFIIGWREVDETRQSDLIVG